MVCRLLPIRKLGGAFSSRSAAHHVRREPAVIGEQWGNIDKIQSDRSASRGPEGKLIKNREIGRVQRQKGRDVCCTVCRSKQCVEHTLPAKLMTPHPGMEKRNCDIGWHGH